MTDTAALIQAHRHLSSDARDRKLDYLFLSRDLTVQSAEILPGHCFRSQAIFYSSFLLSTSFVFHRYPSPLPVISPKNYLYEQSEE